MSKLTEQLRQVRVFNSANFAGNGNVYIEYYPNDNSRGGRGARWAIACNGTPAAPDAPWYANGNKEFSIFGPGAHAEVKARKLDEAKAWASEKYGITEWARTPYGTWMPAEFVKTRMAELRARLAEIAEEKE